MRKKRRVVRIADAAMKSILWVALVTYAVLPAFAKTDTTAYKTKRSVHKTHVITTITKPLAPEPKPINRTNTPPTDRGKSSKSSKSSKPKLKPKRQTVYIATITAYTNGPESTGKRPGDPGYGITYSGKPTQANKTIAADLRVFPLGTKIKIEGLPYVYEVVDKGGAIKGTDIDIFMPDLEDAVEWGVQKREITVVEWGEPKR